MSRTFLLLAAVLTVCCACSRPTAPAAVPVSVPAPKETKAERKPDRPRASLPAELAPFRAALERSELSYAAIIATRQSGTAPWRSKFRGMPYLPQGQTYPLGADGRPLVLLAQINFAEMPALPDYPSAGIVQFFASDEESAAHIYGSLQYDERPFDAGRYFDSMTDQRYFRVVYHANVVQDAARLNTPAVSIRRNSFLPVVDEASLRFETRTEAVSFQDYRFGRFLGKPADAFFRQFGTKEEALANAYGAYAGNWPVAKIGGYTNLVQHDPRETRPNEDWLVLLEIRSAGDDDGVNIMWGDAGVGVFFIRRADLKRRDFSTVAYHWDNH